MRHRYNKLYSGTSAYVCKTEASAEANFILTTIDDNSEHQPFLWVKDVDKWLLLEYAQNVEFRQATKYN